MKPLNTLYRHGAFLVIIPALAFTSVFSSCTGKSNAEDDTFRQSIIDDPVKAQEQNEAAKIGKKKLVDTLAADTSAFH